jgi:hypothetical protein
MFDNVEKTVVRSPFISATHPGKINPSVRLAMRLLHFWTYPSWYVSLFLALCLYSLLRRWSFMYVIRTAVTGF